MKKFVGVALAAGLGVFALSGCSTPEVIVIEAPPKVVEQTETENKTTRPDTLEGNICAAIDKFGAREGIEIVYLTGTEAGIGTEDLAEITYDALRLECPEHIDSVVEALS